MRILLILSLLIAVAHADGHRQSMFSAKGTARVGEQTLRAEILIRLGKKPLTPRVLAFRPGLNCLVDGMLASKTASTVAIAKQSCGKHTITGFVRLRGKARAIATFDIDGVKETWTLGSK